MKLYIIDKIQGIDSHHYISSLANNRNESLGTDYSDPGITKIKISYVRHYERGDIVECSGIIVIRDVVDKVRCPVPHINLNNMLVDDACSI
jgi:hypothetical protein